MSNLLDRIKAKLSLLSGDEQIVQGNNFAICTVNTSGEYKVYKVLNEKLSNEILSMTFEDCVIGMDFIAAFGKGPKYAPKIFIKSNNNNMLDGYTCINLACDINNYITSGVLCVRVLRGYLIITKYGDRWFVKRIKGHSMSKETVISLEGSNEEIVLVNSKGELKERYEPVLGPDSKDIPHNIIGVLSPDLKQFTSGRELEERGIELL